MKRNARFQTAVISYCGLWIVKTIGSADFIMKILLVLLLLLQAKALWSSVKDNRDSLLLLVRAI